MRQLVLIWLVSYKKSLGPRHTQRESHMKTQGEDSRLRAKDGGRRRSQPCWPLGLGLLASRAVRRRISVVQTTHSLELCKNSTSGLKESVLPLWTKGIKADKLITHRQWPKLIDWLVCQREPGLSDFLHMFSNYCALNPSIHPNSSLVGWWGGEQVVYKRLVLSA